MHNIIATFIAKRKKHDLVVKLLFNFINFSLKAYISGISFSSFELYFINIFSIFVNIYLKSLFIISSLKLYFFSNSDTSLIN